jgi:hypothetical protein
MGMGKDCVIKNMNESEVAFKILNRRNSVSPVIMQGELQESLGQAGYELAMAKRWVEPNYDSGELSVTESFEMLQELRDAAAGFKDTPKPEAVPVNNIYRRFASHIPVSNVVEVFSTPTPGGVVDVGDEVTVAENGQPVRAVIKSRKPDGTFELSFDEKSRPKVERTYRAEELKRLNAGKPATPGAPAPAGAPPPAVVPATA